MFRFSLRHLFLLVGGAAIVAYGVRSVLEVESLDFSLASRGPDIVLSSSEFEILFRDCGVGSAFRTEGTFLVAGSTSTSSAKISHGEFELSHFYARGRLHLGFRAANIILREQSGQLNMTVNGTEVSRGTDGKLRAVLSDKGELIFE